jgi:hypothetical protein
VDASNLTVTLKQVSVTNNTSTGGIGGGGYINAGTLAGQLNAGQLTGNSATDYLGIAANPNSLPTITVAPGQQKVEFVR